MGNSLLHSHLPFTENLTVNHETCLAELFDESPYCSIFHVLSVGIGCNDSYTLMLWWELIWPTFPSSPPPPRVIRLDRVFTASLYIAEVLC